MGRVLQQVEREGWHSVKFRSGYTLLHWAASKGRSDFCSHFLCLGAQPRSRDASGRTPFDCAIQAGHSGVAELLLCAGAKVSEEAVHGSAAETAAAGSSSSSSKFATIAHHVFVETLVSRWQPPTASAWFAESCASRCHALNWCKPSCDE